MGHYEKNRSDKEPYFEGEFENEDRLKGKSSFRRRRLCRYCEEGASQLNYLDASAMRLFVSERGKIVPRRISGACAKHQRYIAKSVRRARMVSLVPFVVTNA